MDDLRSNSDYLTNPAGSTIQSATGKRYFQYRAIENSSDELVSGSVSNVSASAVVQIPYPPVFSGGSAVSSSSIVWTHTDASGNEDGFRLYDSLGNYLNFSNTANTTTITETGLAPDTVYSRKVAAYNTYGTSYLSGIASARTLVNVPGAVTVTRSSATTAVINSINSSSNPSNTQYAIYQEAGTVCDGSGGNFVATNGANNGATAAWQVLTSWVGVTVSSLTPESEYVFCAKARNTDLVETVLGPKSVTTGKIIPVTGDLTVDTNLNSATSFITRYRDGNDVNRWIVGLDTIGVANKNTSKVNLTTGSLTINSNETLVAGELNLQGGSLFLPAGGRLAIGSRLWALDRDVDGYPDVTNGEVKLWYGENAPTNAGVPQAYFRRKGLLSTLTTVDCNDNDNTHNSTCCESNGVACASDGACCSSVCGTNADNDALFSASAGHTGTCKVAPALPYTDCNDGNANLLTTQTCYIDSDNDTYTNGTASICAGASCTNVAGYRATSAGSDCNDANATLFRTVSGYLDADGDTYGAGSFTTCAPASGTYVANNTDCGPNTASAYPGSPACSAATFTNAALAQSHDYNCSAGGGAGSYCGTVLTASYYGSVAASNACLGKANNCGQNGSQAVVYFNGGNVGCGVNGYYCSSSAYFTDCSGSGVDCSEWGVSQCNGAALTSQTCN